MTCTDKPICVVGNRLVTLNELFGLIIDLYPKKVNHLIRWEDHRGMELRNFKWLEKTVFEILNEAFIYKILNRLK